MDGMGGSNRSRQVMECCVLVSVTEEDDQPLFHSQSYKQLRVHLDPNIHHLAGYPLGLPQGPLGVPGPHFENRGCGGVAAVLRLRRAVFLFMAWFPC